MWTTTLRQLREHGLRGHWYRTLLRDLTPTPDDDDPVGIEDILDICGLDVAKLALSCVDGHDQEIRIFKRKETIAMWNAMSYQVDDHDIAECSSEDLRRYAYSRAYIASAECLRAALRGEYAEHPMAGATISANRHEGA